MLPIPLQVRITDILTVKEGFNTKIVKYAQVLDDDEDDEDEDEDFVSVEIGDDTMTVGSFVYLGNDLKVGDLLELSFKKVIQVKG